MMMALVLEHGAEDPPPSVETILVVFAVLPTACAVLLIAHSIYGVARNVASKGQKLKGAQPLPEAQVDSTTNAKVNKEANVDVGKAKPILAAAEAKETESSSVKV